MTDLSVHLAKTLDQLQRDSFGYFLHEVNPDNGLVLDKTRPDWPASIAGIGMALAAYTVGAERGFITRQEACVFSRAVNKAGGRMQAVTMGFSIGGWLD